MFIKKDLKYSFRNELKIDDSNTEDIWLEIKLGRSKTYVFGFIYRHPKKIRICCEL